MVNIELARLQYEILGRSLEELADHLDVPLDLLQEEAKKKKWKQTFPEDNTPPIYDEDEDAFAAELDNYVEKTRKRLVAFSLARDVFLSQKYLELEASILEKANELILSENNASSVSAVKALADLYKNMSKSVLSAGYNPAISIGLDEGSLPTVIVRDLSGQGLNKEKK